MFNAYKLHEVRDTQFYMMPKSLFDNPLYSKDNLSLTSKVIYAFLLDRMELSRQNNWVDEKGRIYLIYTRENIAEALEISLRSVQTCFKELNDCNLIREVRQGLGQPNLIHVGHIAHQDMQNLHIRDANIAHQDMQNLHSNNTNTNNTNFNKTDKKDLANGQSTQKTFFNLPVQEKPTSVKKKKLTQSEQAEEKITSAKQTDDWSKVTDRDFTYYYIQRHNELFKQISFDRFSSVGIIRDSFISRHKIDREKVCDYIDEILTLYSQHPNKWDSLTFNMIDKNTTMMKDLIRQAELKLKPVEIKFKYNDFDKTEKANTDDLSSDEIF